MPRLILDPNLLECPDFTTILHAPTRALLTNPTTTDAQAAELLKTVWQTTNAAEKLTWEQQTTADQAALAEQHRLDDAALAAAEALKEQERLDHLNDDRKKHASKYAPIPNLPVPSNQPVLSSDFALAKLTKDAYLPLWHFTNAALTEADKTLSSTADDTMVLKTDPDGALA